MSWETWKALYYPVEADEVKGRIETTQHSLRKWEGLRPDVLKEHGLELCRGQLNEWISETAVSTRLWISGDSCALCKQFDGAGEGDCEQCPLAMVREGVTCVRSMRQEESSPYAHFMDNKDPEPMIQWLQAALKAEEEKLKSPTT